MKMIALANHKGGVMDFYLIVRDDGRELLFGDVRFEYTGKNTEQVQKWLRDAKRAYMQDYKRLLDKQHKTIDRLSKSYLCMHKQQAIQTYNRTVSLQYAERF